MANQLNWQQQHSRLSHLSSRRVIKMFNHPIVDSILFMTTEELSAESWHDADRRYARSTTRRKT